MPSNETKVRQAIKARISSLPISYDRVWTDDGHGSLPATGGLPSPYIECHFEPNQNIRVFVGSRAAHERPSLLFMTLCWPLADVGKTHIDAIRQIASEIAEHFHTDMVMRFRDVGVRVTRLPDVLGSYRDDAYLRTQVRVSLETQK